MRLHGCTIVCLVGFMWVRTSRSQFLSNLSPLYKVMSTNVSSVRLVSM